MPRDILYPFMSSGKNRNETLLIECSGFLYNRSAAFVIGMLSYHDRYIEKFPNLALFYGMSACQIYEATKYFDPIELLIQMLPDGITESPDFDGTILFETVEELEKMDIRNFLVTPMFAYALTNMLKEKCCEKVLIAKHRAFSSSEQKYLFDLLSSNRSKVELVEGSFFDIWDENKDAITTSFANAISDIEAIEEYCIKNDMQAFMNDKLFMLRVSNSNIELDPVSKVYRFTKDIIDTTARLSQNNIHLGMIHPTIFSISDDRRPVYIA